jgi:hypothetical protein
MLYYQPSGAAGWSTSVSGHDQRKSPHAGVRMRTDRVSRWKDAAMVRDGWPAHSSRPRETFVVGSV